MVNKPTLSVKQINARATPRAPQHPSHHLHAAPIRFLFQHSPLQLHFMACTRLRARISDGSGELDCHYLSPSPPQLSLFLTPYPPHI